jgi:hypothetical protein
MLDLVRKYTGLLADVVTVLGIVFAVWQYYEIKQDGRITATLGYATRFDSSPLADSVDKLNAEALCLCFR